MHEMLVNFRYLSSDQIFSPLRRPRIPMGKEKCGSAGVGGGCSH